jgi:hypothetical protein
MQGSECQRQLVPRWCCPERNREGIRGRGFHPEYSHPARERDPGETGLRSDDVRNSSCAPRGRTAWSRFATSGPGLGLISAVTNKGELRWVVLDKAINAPTLIRFHQRMIQNTPRKLFLILDRLRVHGAGQVRDWLAAHRARIEVLDLPSYTTPTKA